MNFTDNINKRDELMLLANQSGWNVDINKITKIKNPAFFYIFEPLNSGFMGVGAFNQADLAKARANAEKNKDDRSFNLAFGSMNSQFFEDLPKAEFMLPMVLESHIYSFAQTQTAIQSEAHNFNSFGAIVYLNHKLPPEKRLIVRPVGLGQAQPVHSAKDTLGFMMQYLNHDYSVNKDTFYGLDFDAIFDGHVQKYHSM